MDWIPMIVGGGVCVAGIVCLLLRVNGWASVACVIGGFFTWHHLSIMRSAQKWDDLVAASETASAATAKAEADPTLTELTRACDALSENTTETIESSWIAARKAVGDVLQSQRWFGGRLSWLANHELEGVLTVCGIDGAARAGLINRVALTVLRGSTSLDRLLQDHRAAFCTYGAMLAEAQSAAPWGTGAVNEWEARCVRLLASPAVEEPPPPPIAAIPPPDIRVPCDGLQDLAAQLEPMMSKRLDDAQWIAFGATLTQCDPSREPWTQLRLAGGRKQFEREYITRFLNGDAITGDRFASAHSKDYKSLAKAWGFEGL